MIFGVVPVNHDGTGYRSPGRTRDNCGMTVNRTHDGHATRYEMPDGAGLRILSFDTGEEGNGPAAWKIMLPGLEGTEDLYSVREFPKPDAAQLTTWLTHFVGQDAATELAKAVAANPPPAADWQHPAGG